MLLDGTELDDDEVLQYFSSEVLIVKSSVVVYIDSDITLTDPLSSVSSIFPKTLSIDEDIAGNDINQFRIPFNKLPVDVSDKILKGSSLTHKSYASFVAVVSDEALKIFKNPLRRELKNIAQYISTKYPKTFADRDDSTSALIGDGYITLLKKLEERVKYLKRKSHNIDENCELKIKKRKRNDKENLPYIPSEGESDRLWLNQEISKATRNETKIEIVFKETFAEQRRYINYGSKPIKDIYEMWPILFEKKYMLLHFKLLYEVDIFENVFKILKNDTKYITKLGRKENSCLHAVIDTLTEYFKEESSGVIRYFEVSLQNLFNNLSNSIINLGSPYTDRDLK